jgi:pimeloyl-ACP methyl ester carboxylesterase
MQQGETTKRLAKRGHPMVRQISVLRSWPWAAGLGLAVVAMAATAQTQPAAPLPSTPINPQRVPITTADFVELDGTYYQSTKAGRDSPCVLMVNKYGSDRSKTDWINLAGLLQNAGFAVLTFDLRGHGNSQQLSNPAEFWGVSYNRNGIRGGTSPTKKSSISYTDFKPNYLPFLVNDLAAARKFLEQKNDAGELNVHSLFVIGAQEGADLGLLFTAAEYRRIYRVGLTALQSNGTAYNAGEDIAAGVWLSMTTRPGMPAGGPNFNLVNWIRSYPLMRDKTPMCFVYGEKDNRSKNDSDSVFKALTAPMNGRPEKHKLDKLQPIRGTDLAGPALLGQPALNVPQDVLTFCQKVMTERRAIAWTEVKPETNILRLIPLGPFGL